MPLDYEYELGNGWDRYQIMVLGEMKRLADNAERQSALLTAATIDIALLKAAEAKSDATHQELYRFMSEYGDRLRQVEEENAANEGDKEGANRTHERWKSAAWVIGSNIITWSIFLITGIHHHF